MSNQRPNVSELNREQLVELVELLLARVSTLEKQVARLTKVEEKVIQKTSQNSSVPPSQDQKSNRSSSPKAKRGAKAGHPGMSRQRAEPDEVIEYRVGACRGCGMDVTDRPQWVVGSHQVIDLPPQRAMVREARRYRTTCPHCQQQQTAEYGEGFEKGQMFGRHLEQIVLYLHYAHPLSYGRVQRVLADLYGLKLSRGALVNGVKRAQTHLKQAADVLHQQLKQAVVVGSDETTARVDGITYWQWVFQTPRLAYHVIRASRAAQVLREVMADAQPEVWVSDALSSQMCHPATDYQLCLAHQVRDLQYAIDSHHCAWAQQVQTLFDDSLRLHRQRGDLDADHFYHQRGAYEQRLDDLLLIAPDNVDSETLRGRFVKHR
jgi:transposase